MKTLKVNCTICQKEVSIKLPGSYSDILECGHVVTKIQMNKLAKGVSLVDAEAKSKELTKISELPKIDGNELVSKVLRSINQSYEDFFTAENPTIESIINEHGKDNAILIFTAIHFHLSKVLFGVNRFRSLYAVNIEKLRKEIEDNAVKELIKNHDFTYENLGLKAPKEVKTPRSKSGTDIDKAKQGLSGLTGKDGKPVDVMKVLGNLMWKQDKVKAEYKEGLDKIKESIVSKDK